MGEDDQPLHKNNFFLETFSHREAGMGLAALIDPGVSSVLDWPTLRILPTSFVDPSLKARQADMLYGVRLQGTNEEAYVYVLLEHQTTIPRRMLNRMHGYLLRIEEHHFKAHPEAAYTPVVIAVILHQGKNAWNAPRQFVDTYGLSEEQQARLLRHIPDFQCEIISLPAIQLEQLQLNMYLAAALDLMKSFRDGTILQCIQRIERPLLRIQHEHGDTHFVIACYCYAHYAEGVDFEALHDIFEKIDQPELKRTAMTAADQLIQRGKFLGRQEGRQEGHQEGRREGLLEGRLAALQQAVLDALEARHNRVPEGLAERIREISDDTTLRRLVKAAARADSVEDFVREL